MTFLITFIILSIINVTFSTYRSIVTIKGGKTIAALVSGGYFAFYNIMLIYTVADFPMWQKCLITFFCNVLGVWVVKYIEEKSRKAKLWKVESTVNSSQTLSLHHELESFGIPHNYIADIGTWTIFNIYCATEKESAFVRQVLNRHNAKYFVSETKDLY